MQDGEIDAFIAKYMAADGKLPGDAQAGYVLDPSFDLVPADLVDDAASHLVANLERRDLATGFLGTPDLLAVLSENGHANVAYRLLNQRSYPSWGTRSTRARRPSGSGGTRSCRTARSAT